MLIAVVGRPAPNIERETRAELCRVRPGEFTLSLTIKTVCEAGWPKRPVRHVLFNLDANP